MNQRYTRVGLSLTAALVLMTESMAGTSAAGGPENKPTFWLIPHTHWEGAVFKTREDYLEMGLPHILTAIRLLREQPDFRFTLDQVAYFKPFLERYPEEAEAFRKFVAEGRLQIVGGMDVMPDDNMPSGESFVRQVLYAKSYCREALGVEVKVGWLLDTFGHHAQMPQLLRQAGFDSFWYARGVADRAATPSEFLWEGLDGTRIRAFWLPFSYGFLYGPPADLAHFTTFIQDHWNALAPFSRNADRVGLAGVDVSEPELYVAPLIAQFNRQPNMPFALRMGVPTDFEAKTPTNLPVITGERNPLFQGIYSSRIELKQMMREVERLMTTAEALGALAEHLGASLDRQKIWQAWEPTWFNITHDLASGVMTDYVYEDTLRSYDCSLRLAAELVDTALEGILPQIDTRGAGVPLVVFNTLGWQRTDVAQADVGFAEAGVVDVELFDSAGAAVPAQLIASEHFQDGGLRRVKLAFLAKDIPSLGYSVYHLAPRKTACQTKVSTSPGDTNSVLENEFFRAVVDSRTGTLTSLRSKTGDWEALAGPANLVALEPDNGDFWELYHNLDGGQNVIMTRPLKVPESGQARFSNQEPGTNSTVRSGPVFSEVGVQHPLGSNLFATTIRVYQGVQRLDCETRILNRDRFVRYRLLVPTTVKDGHNFQEIPFGAVERPAAQEFPAQNWIDYSGGGHGVTLLNRGLPGNNVADGTLMLSLMRSTRIQAYGIGGGFEGQGSDSGLELGKERTFHYALIPHAGDWRQAEACRAGLEFNHPLVVHKPSVHPGGLPGRWSWLEVSPANVVLSAVRSAGDGATIVRVYEAAGQMTTRAGIKLHANVLAANDSDLMENTGPGLKVRDDTIQFELRPFQIKTMKLGLKKRAK